MYVVTAKHVIDGIRKHSIDATVFLRLNTKQNGAQFADTPLDAWIMDENDPYLDIAALPWSPRPEIVDFRHIPSSLVADEEIIAKHGIGVGDETFLAGLFVNHYGQKRNIPIVRMGAIAAMPDERVQVQFDDASVFMDAYLIEARSIGGLSGSPVFVHLSAVRHGNLVLGGPQFYLLGLMHGHWDVHFSVEDVIEQDNVRGEAVNMGIAIVVPATKILDVLNQPREVAKRKADETRLQSAAGSSE